MREKLKNGLIIALIVSAIVLGWQSRLFGNAAGSTGVFTGVFGWLGGNTDNGGAAIKTQTSGAAKPMCIAVTNDMGVHFGVRYDMSMLGEVYEKAVLRISDAFDAASSSYEIDKTVWQEALLTQGIYFEYLSPVKISVLDGWFGTQISGDWGSIEVRRLCVAFENGTSRLFFEQYGTGRYYAADAGESDGIASLTDSLGVNSAVFAFETESDAVGDDYALLLPDEDAHPVILANNPLYDTDVMAAVLAGLGITEQPSYQNASGAVNYIDNTFMLKVNTDGTVIYRLRESGGTQGQLVSESEAVEMARTAVTDSIGRYCGEAAVYFDTLKLDEGSYTVTFRYVIAGGIVQLYQDGNAAVVTVKDGKITQMELRFRSYAASGDTVKLLPEVQAAVASGGPFTLCYADNGSYRLDPVWVEAPSYPS